MLDGFKDILGQAGEWVHWGLAAGYDVAANNTAAVDAARAVVDAASDDVDATDVVEVALAVIALGATGYAAFRQGRNWMQGPQGKLALRLEQTFGLFVTERLIQEAAVKAILGKKEDAKAQLSLTTKDLQEKFVGLMSNNLKGVRDVYEMMTPEQKKQVNSFDSFTKSAFYNMLVNDTAEKHADGKAKKGYETIQKDMIPALLETAVKNGKAKADREAAKKAAPKAPKAK